MTRVLKLMFTEWLFSVVNTDTVYELERQIAKNYSFGGSCIACQNDSHVQKCTLCCIKNGTFSRMSMS